MDYSTKSNASSRGRLTARSSEDPSVADLEKAIRTYIEATADDRNPARAKAHNETNWQSGH